MRWRSDLEAECAALLLRRLSTVRDWLVRRASCVALGADKRRRSEEGRGGGEARQHHREEADGRIT